MNSGHLPAIHLGPQDASPSTPSPQKCALLVRHEQTSSTAEQTLSASSPIPFAAAGRRFDVATAGRSRPQGSRDGCVGPNPAASFPALNAACTSKDQRVRRVCRHAVSVPFAHVTFCWLEVPPGKAPKLPRNSSFTSTYSAKVCEPSPGPHSNISGRPIADGHATTVSMNDISCIYVYRAEAHFMHTI
jgi:hypothetical protein